MKLFLAGGVGEHGRNCFYVRGEHVSFLMDCGKMADMPEDPYPRLTPEMIRSLDVVFLTHSHADHTGALPWLYDNGFDGPVVAAEATLSQLTFAVRRSAALEEVCPGGTGVLRVPAKRNVDKIPKIKNQENCLNISWGRTGHCKGSVWYSITENEKCIFFSGDYTEDTLVYRCDPIRGQRADLAVIDCAYGYDITSYQELCGKLLKHVKALLDQYGLVVLPVPKFGRGLEILKLLSDNLGITYYGDDLFIHNLAEAKNGGFWYLPSNNIADVKPYEGQSTGIVFVSDPQLRSSKAQETVKQVIGLGGRAVLTGTVERGTYSEEILKKGDAEQIRYPVHLNYEQYKNLIGMNEFTKTIPYHSADLPNPSPVSV
jgi:glyoxylase-like metal-dependent hydrolase (beta-lactamase superfamily II)